MSEVALNPKDGFGTQHVILNGRTDKPLRVESFAGPFSIKSVLRGVATWQTDRGRYVLTPGRHLVLSRGTRYSLSIDAGSAVETFCVFFRDGFVEEALHSITTPGARLLDDPDERATSFALLESIQDDALHPAPELRVVHRIVQDDGVDAVALSGALHDTAVAIVTRAATLCRLSRHVPAIRAVTRRELLRRLQVARVYMRSRLETPPPLAEIAREACLSPFHLHRNFRALFGETPHQYVLRLRLDHAADRLRRTSAPVTDIALAVGFSSPAHFSRAFKRRFRLSPAHYRRQFGR